MLAEAVMEEARLVLKVTETVFSVWITVLDSEAITVLDAEAPWLYEEVSDSAVNELSDSWIGVLEDVETMELKTPLETLKGALCVKVGEVEMPLLRLDIPCDDAEPEVVVTTKV